MVSRGCLEAEFSNPQNIYIFFFLQKSSHVLVKVEACKKEKYDALHCFVRKTKRSNCNTDTRFLGRNKKDEEREMRDKGMGERERNRPSKETEATVNTSMLK